MISHTGIAENGVTKNILQTELDELYKYGKDYEKMKDFYHSLLDSPDFLFADD